MTATVASSRSNNDNDNANDKDRPKRAFCSHQPKWQRFQPTLLKPETKKSAVQEPYQYQRQYSHVYSHRLVALKPRCWTQFESLPSTTAASSASSAGASSASASSSATTTTTTAYTRVQRVLELREDVPSRIVGTLVKEAPEATDEVPLVEGNYCRASDQLFLEDESGRVTLQLLKDGPHSVHDFCTGVVVGVQGKVDIKGTFHVEALVLPAAPPLHALSGTVIPTAGDQPPHLLIVSSLLCGDPNVSSLPRELLLAYLQGQFTQDAAKVSRVLVVGGGPSSQDPLNGVKELDAFLLQLTRAGIPVDILPGKDDPTTANWPQRALHSSLLPHATQIVHRTPNPYAAALGNQLVVATDGSNVKDLQAHCLVVVAAAKGPTTEGDDTEGDAEDAVMYEPCTELQALQTTLEWSHLCPTGPDSVPTVPHLDQDPMVLSERPQLYVSGNATEFATVVHPETGTTCVCVPSFAQTGQAVLVNLESRHVELLQFEDVQE